MVEESKSAPSTPGSIPAGAPAQPATSTPATTPTPAGQPAGTPAQPATSTLAATPTPAAQPADAPALPPAETQPAGLDTPAIPPDPGFLERGGLRRRLRFLRKTRELAYRDLGGLVFEMQRLGQERKDLLDGKLATLGRIDRELRAIEDALRERRGVTVLREAGVTACPRCAAIHGSEDRFCPACGFSMGRTERPIAGTAPVGAPSQAPTTPPPLATARPNPSSMTPATGTTRAAAPPTTPFSAPEVPSTSPAPAAEPSRAGGPAPAATAPAANGPAQPPSDADEPTEIVEAPTRIVRPAGEPPAGDSRRT